MKNDKVYKSKVVPATAGTTAGDDLIGNPERVDTNNIGYRKLQDMMRIRSEQFTAEEKREIEFNAIRYRRMEYVKDDDSEE